MTNVGACWYTPGMEFFLLTAHIIIGFSSIISMFYCAYRAFTERMLGKALPISAGLFAATVVSGIGLIFAGAGFTRVCLMIVIYSTIAIGALSFIRKRTARHSDSIA